MDRGSFGLHFRASRQSLDFAYASSLIGAGIRFVTPWDAIATAKVSTIIITLATIIVAAYEECFGLAMLAAAVAAAAVAAAAAATATAAAAATVADNY